MRVGVYGIGNVLRRDDGFGPSVVERLASAWSLPGEVDLRDLGTPGLDLTSYVMGLDALVLLDAIEGGDDPGTLHVHTKTEVLEQAVRGCRTSTHEAGLREALHVADAAGEGPGDVWLIGVVPKCMDTGTGLSAEVAGRVEEACRLAVATLASLGLHALPRADARPSGAWWETAE